MYKRAVSVLLLGYLVLVFGLICVKGLTQNRQAMEPVRGWRVDEKLLSRKDEATIGIADASVSEERILDVQFLDCERTRYDLSEEDMDMLLRIVEAEAGNQDEDGRLLVANVVLNRMTDEKFPATVKEVVLQRENGTYQFSPAGSGRLWQVKVSEETRQAIDRALAGDDISDGALYFVSRKYADSEHVKWFDDHLTFLFSHGGHEFFR